MMWPSQNFLLYNGTRIKIKINKWINNLKKYVTSDPPPLEIHITCTNCYNLISKKSKLKRKRASKSKKDFNTSKV